MSNSNRSRDVLINALYDAGAFRFDGPFTLKSGITSPFYVDLRVLVSKPDLLEQVAAQMLNIVRSLNFDVVCGVPYTALPIATAISLQSGHPMVIRRKEGPKSYGTKKLVEGIIVKGQTCLLVEDLVTSGLSVFETIEPIEDQGLRVQDVVVILDREQGGRVNIEDRGVRLHSVMTITDVLKTLLENGKISSTQFDQSKAFIENNQVSLPKIAALPVQSSNRSYESKANLAKNPKLRMLLQLMQKKKTNLCLSADVTSCCELLKIATQLGPFICMIKTHIDIVTDFTPSFCDDLRHIAQSQQFMIWEDRKFADIGNTVLRQFTGGVYKISQWADFVSIHAISGPGIIDALKQGSAETKGRCQGAFVLAQMSSEGSLMSDAYAEAAVAMSQNHLDFIAGFISQKRVSDDPGTVQITPGVQLQKGGDELGQRYNTPDQVIGKQCADIIVVGRGIIAADDREQVCRRYQEAGWSAYQGRLLEQPQHSS